MSEFGRRSGAPTEARAGRKAETDRVCEGISEGFRRPEPERVAPRGPKANASMAPIFSVTKCAMGTRQGVKAIGHVLTPAFQSATSNGSFPSALTFNTEKPNTFPASSTFSIT